MPESIRPYNGMQLDTFPTRKEEAFYNFALNSVLEGDDIAMLQNERSNDISFLLPGGYVQIGAIPMSNNETAILSTNETSSEIGIFDGFGYTTYANLDLGFTRNALIKGIYNTVRGCERSIYWKDGVNPDYFFNFDDVDFFKTGSSFDPDKFRLQPITTLPQISNLEVVDGGGTLLMGTYEFVVEVLDELLNPVNRSIVSRMVSVYDDSVNDSYNAIDGAVNSESNPDGLPPTSKSIIVTVNNLDTAYSYFRIYVVRRTGGDGISREVFKKSDVTPISSSTGTYIFRGVTNTDTRETLDKLLIRSPYYESSEVNLIVDRKHVRFNLKGANIDYSNFQRVVNNITTSCVIKEVLVTDAQERGNSKQPSTYFDTMNFQSDEVHAKGIVFVFKQGFYSPVFHIPGRQATAFDTALITVVDNSATPTATQVREADVVHLNLGVGDTIERWKVFNTGNASGQMGYYEVSTLYPTIEDCNGEPVFGDLAGQPIRHHLFPDRRSIPLIEDGQIKLLGVQFDNVQYPHPDIVGHFFVMGERDEFNRTIVDGGYAGTLIKGTNLTPPQNEKFGIIYARPSSQDTTSDYGFFISPKTQIEKFPFSGTYLKFISTLQANTITPSGGEESEYPLFDGGTIRVDSTIVDSYGNSLNSNPLYRNILSSFYAEPISLTLQIEGFDDIDGVRNTTLHHSLIVRMSDDIVSPFLGSVTIPFVHWYLSYLKDNKEVFTDLFTVRYQPISKIETYPTSSEIYGGDCFISSFNTFNPDIILFGNSGPEWLFLTSQNILLCESQLNSGMRYGTTGRCGIVYKTQDANDYSVSRLALLQDNGEYIVRPESTFCEEEYLYNIDYSYFPLQQGLIALPLNYNYCSKCVAEFPNRIIWSEKSQVEGSRNSFRIFLEENYTIAGENLGAITGAHYDNNQLVVNCEDGFVVKIPNPQAIQTDESELYIGTGDFLSLPERQLISTDYGFGGCRNVFSTVRTPRGYAWLDERAGKIFLKSNSLDELSSPKYGCSRWMKANLPLVLPIQFHELFGEEYTGSDSRYQLAYDPIHERLIVHKTDWKFTNIGRSKVLGGDITYDNGKFYEGGAIVPFTNTTVFENKGFTISFSFILQAWSSFHSWQPFFMWTGYEAFYSNLEDNAIWKHNVQPDGISAANLSFYGTIYDWIIDYTVFSTSTMTLNSLLYYGETMLDYAPAIVNFPTFDRMWIYSSQQSTGLKNIVPLDNPYGNQIGFSFTDVDVVKRAEDYRISNIYDYSASEFYYSDTWQDKLSFYNGTQGYIDKVPLASPTGITLYDLAPLRGKYFNIRLFSSSPLDMKFDFLASFNKPFEL